MPKNPNNPYETWSADEPPGPIPLDSTALWLNVRNLSTRDQKLFTCKACKSAFRIADHKGDKFLICDHCEVFIIAPRSMHDLLTRATNGTD